jgi:hypothetical protein
MHLNNWSIAASYDTARIFACNYSSDSASPDSVAEAEASRTSQQNADDSSRRIDDVVRHDDEMNATIDAANAAAAAAVSSGN